MYTLEKLVGLMLGKGGVELFLEKCKGLRDREEIAEVPEEQDVEGEVEPNRKLSKQSGKS